MDHARSYRKLCSPGKDEVSYQVVVEQSDLYIISIADYSAEVLARLNRIRGDIKGHISACPDFAASLTPLELPGKPSPVIKDMYEAAALFNVGPMAAVAGAVAHHIGSYLSRFSSEALVENGGDIFICSTRNRVVGLLPYPHEPLTLGIKVSSRSTPCAICSSSATIGHSLSLGRGDLVAVKSRSGAVADAAATALCNLISTRKSLKKLAAMKNDLSQKGILGVLAQRGEEMTVWGDMELTLVQS